MRKKAVEGWLGYYVTEDGRVLSCRSNSGKADKPSRDLAPQPNRTGHMRVRLSNRGKTTMAFVHKLVLEAFVGSCPDGLVSRHKDGNPANNRLGNLEWATSSVNRMDMWAHGTMPHGSGMVGSKLDEAIVLDMRIRFAAGGVDVQDLAEDYGVNPTTIGNALRGVNWKHVGGPLAPSCRPSGARHWRRR